jgi:hypothetical protein
MASKKPTNARSTDLASPLADRLPATPQHTVADFGENTANIERLPDLVEGLMRRVSNLETVNTTAESALIAKIEFLERRLEDVEAVANAPREQQIVYAKAEPIEATIETTQLALIEHKLVLLNNSIGVF